MIWQKQYETETEDTVIQIIWNLKGLIEMFIGY